MAIAASTCLHVRRSRIPRALGADADDRKVLKTRVVAERLEHGAADHRDRARIAGLDRSAALAGEEALVAVARRSCRGRDRARRAGDAPRRAPRASRGCGTPSRGPTAAHGRRARPRSARRSPACRLRTAPRARASLPTMPADRGCGGSRRRRRWSPAQGTVTMLISAPSEGQVPRRHPWVCSRHSHARRCRITPSRRAPP